MSIIETKCVNWFTGNPIYYDCLRIFGIDYKFHLYFIIGSFILSLILFIILYFINKKNNKFPLKKNLLLSFIIFIVILIVLYSYTVLITKFSDIRT